MKRRPAEPWRPFGSARRPHPSPPLDCPSHPAPTPALPYLPHYPPAGRRHILCNTARAYPRCACACCRARRAISRFAAYAAGQQRRMCHVAPARRHMATSAPPHQRTAGSGQQRVLAVQRQRLCLTDAIAPYGIIASKLQNRNAHAHMLRVLIYLNSLGSTIAAGAISFLSGITGL